MTQSCYRMFRPSVPETLRLGADGVTYDTGIAPFRHDLGSANRKDARVDLARAASEVERAWLHRVLAERYSLPAG